MSDKFHRATNATGIGAKPSKLRRGNHDPVPLVQEAGERDDLRFSEGAYQGCGAADRVSPDFVQPRGASKGLWLVVAVLWCALFLGGIGTIRIHGEITLGRIAAALFLLMSIPFVLKREPGTRALLLIFGGVWFLAFWVAATPSEPLEIKAVISMAFYCLLAYAVSTLGFSRKQIKLLRIAVVSSGVLVAVSAAYEFHTGSSLLGKYVPQVNIVMSGVYRVRGALGDPNASGGVIAVASIALISAPVFRNRLLLAAVVPLLAVYAYGLYAVASRTAFATLGMGLIALILLRARKGTSPQLITLIILAVVLVASSATLLRGRELSYDADVSAHNRVLLAKDAMRLLAERPVFGHGSSGQLAAHNNLLQVAILSGVVGLSFYIVIHVLALVPLWRYRSDPLASSVASMMVALVTLGMGVTWINSLFYWIWIGICFSLPSWVTYSRLVNDVNFENAGSATRGKSASSYQRSRRRGRQERPGYR